MFTDCMESLRDMFLTSLPMTDLAWLLEELMFRRLVEENRNRYAV